MNFPMQIKAIGMGKSILCFKESQIGIGQFWCIFVPENCFYINKHVDPDEMPHYAAFHLGLPCLLKYLFRGLQYT